MSSFFQSYRVAATSDSAPGDQQQAFGVEYPLLLEAMRGSTGETSEQTVWPCTLSLFWEGDTLKFCLSPKCGPRICFGTVSDASKGLDGVEKALQDNHFEWKKRSRKVSS